MEAAPRIEQGRLVAMIRVIGFGLAMMASLSGGSALAMTNQTALIRCSVERAEKLPPGLTADGVCASIRAAADPQARRAGVSPSAIAVKITVESDRKLTGALSIGDHVLPEHHVGISDRALNARAVNMLAAALAAEIASAKK